MLRTTFNGFLEEGHLVQARNTQAVGMKIWRASSGVTLSRA
jgi:hypothetical protein